MKRSQINYKQRNSSLSMGTDSNFPLSISHTIIEKSQSFVNSGFGHDFGHVQIQHIASAPAFQSKLTISQPGDPYEQEADRIADAVVDGGYALVGSGSATPNVQRDAADEPPPQSSGQPPPPSPDNLGDPASLGLPTHHVWQSANAAVHETLRSSGQPLDDTTRALMEPSFGHDFGHVRIHTGTQAANSAASVSALAYTVGRNVVFGAGQYQPATEAGQRLIAHELAHVVQQGQRQDTLARQPIPAPAPGQAVPVPAPPQPEAETAPVPETAGKKTFGFAAKSDSQRGGNFEALYIPVGPSPAVGVLDIQLWVHITWRDFSPQLLQKSRANKEFATDELKHWKPTPEQARDFKWTPQEKADFEIGFMESVRQAWSEKHTMVLNSPNYDPHRCTVQVNVVTVDQPELAHIKMTAQKMPKNAPRLRSQVDGHTAVLDQRDASEDKEHKELDVPYTRPVGPFDINSAEMNKITTLQTELAAVEIRILERRDPTPKRKLLLAGRSSSPGSEAHNRDLGQRRAEAVKSVITGKLNLQNPVDIATYSYGESNASADPKFQRVDIDLLTLGADGNIEQKTHHQRTAAHEAGHMFGLGDEYIEEDADKKGYKSKFRGDEPDHYEDVKNTMGQSAADELLVNESDSIMSAGMTVRRGHYVYFLQALNRITGESWTVE